MSLSEKVRDCPGWTEAESNEAVGRLHSHILDCADEAEALEAYAKEGWDWLSDALDALGVETVFGIKSAKTRRKALEANTLTPEQARATVLQLTDAAWAYPLDGPVLEEAYKVLRRSADQGGQDD